MAFKKSEARLRVNENGAKIMSQTNCIQIAWQIVGRWREALAAWNNLEAGKQRKLIGKLPISQLEKDHFKNSLCWHEATKHVINLIFFVPSDSIQWDVRGKNRLQVHVRGWQTLSVKDQIGNISCFADHMVSVTTVQLCYYSTKRATDNRE